MRRLLLLLLTFLLPLQLLAATVVDLPSPAGQGAQAAGAERWSCPPTQASSFERKLADLSSLPSLNAASAADGMAADAGQGDDEGDDVDAPALQAELEDHTIPARIATPDIPWQPFPHAFSTPLTWPSFVRDQLRPPPLA